MYYENHRPERLVRIKAKGKGKLIVKYHYVVIPESPQGLSEIQIPASTAMTSTTQAKGY
jgi:hypothetical protein